MSDGINCTLDVFCLNTKLNEESPVDSPRASYDNDFLAFYGENGVVFSFDEKIHFAKEEDKVHFKGRFRITTDLLTPVSGYLSRTLMTRCKLYCMDNKDSDEFTDHFVSPFANEPLVENGYIFVMKLNVDNQLCLHRMLENEYDPEKLNKLTQEWLLANQDYVIDYTMKDPGMSCSTAIVLSIAHKKTCCMKKFHKLQNNETKLIRKCEKLFDNHWRFQFSAHFKEFVRIIKRPIIVVDYKGSVTYGDLSHASNTETLIIAQGPNGKFFPMIELPDKLIF
jgi:hypothetical protein